LIDQLLVTGVIIPLKLNFLRLFYTDTGLDRQLDRQTEYGAILNAALYVEPQLICAEH